MEEVQAIIIRVVIFLVIAQLSHTAPQDAGNMVTSQQLDKRVPSFYMTEGEKNYASFHSVEKRHSQVFEKPPMFVQNCNTVSNLDYGDSAVFFSEDGIDRRRCRYRFKSPKDTRINIECPIFNLNREGCKMESFTINERGKKKETFCKRNKPPVGSGTSNRITVAYRRNKDKIKKNNKSRGYICRAFVIMEDPMTTTTSSSTSSSTSSTWETGYTGPEYTYPVTSSNTVSSTSTSSENSIGTTSAPTWFPTPSSADNTISATTLFFTFPPAGKRK